MHRFYWQPGFGANLQRVGMFCWTDCEQRERQRQTKNDEAQSRSNTAREEFFRAVEPEVQRNMPTR